ncbi:MAG: hydrogenase formation protein HypD [Candidatus Omnitrophota bacterium]
MKYIDEFRNIKLVKKLAGKINQIMPAGEIRLMEVCGTHTQNFHRFCLNKLLPLNLKLISGPGCPVCVSSQDYIDTAIDLSKRKDTTIVTFGDMLRVPGNNSTLEEARSQGANIAVVYSPLDAIKIAKDYPEQKTVFLAVGFETTAPAIALSIILAKKSNLKNLFFSTALKTIPAAMDFLVQDPRLKIEGFLCPGHVSSIIGTKPYEFIPKKYKIGCCVAGFEPVDIMEGLYLLLQQIVKKNPHVENQYIRGVNSCGNIAAQKLMLKVFKKAPAQWRALGVIGGSGLKIRDEFGNFDAENVFPVGRRRYTISSKQKKCRCFEVLKGLINPDECSLFRKSCTPEHAFGPCMVSQEGACNAYYKYH